MKKFFHILVLSSLLLTGCYDDLRDQEQSRLGDLRDVKIASLDTQLQEIMSSVNTLSQLSSEIETYIDNLQKAGDDLKSSLSALNSEFESTKSGLQNDIDGSKAMTIAEFEKVKAALEARISDIDAVVSALQAKKASLDSRLDLLRQHADDDFVTMDWAEGTLATFESQMALQADVAGIKAYVDKLSESLIAVENEINEILGGKLAEITVSLDENLKRGVEKLAQDYKSVIASLSDDVSAAFSDALAAAISASESSLETWVSEQLSGYYTVAEARAKLEAFSTLVGTVPEGKDIQSQIDDLLAAIGSTEEELTEAFTAAINAAVGTSASDMENAILDKVNEVKSEVSDLSTRVETLEGELAGFWTRLGELESKVNTIQGQLDAISVSIKVLSDLDITLEEYIEDLQKRLSDADIENYGTVNALIVALQEEVDSLKERLDSLEDYVGTRPDGTDSIVDWVIASRKSVEKQIATYSAVSRIETIKEEIEGEIESAGISISELGASISTKIMESKETIDDWIDSQLTDYHDPLTILNEFEKVRISLKAAIDPKDSELGSSITDLGTQLSDAVEQFGKDYAAAIEQAIKDNAGKVTEIIGTKVSESALKVNALKERLDDIEKAVGIIKDDLKEIKGDVSQMKGDVSTIQTFVKDAGCESLQIFVNYLMAELAKCEASYATIAQLETLKEVLYGDGKTTFGLKGKVAEITDLTKRLEAAETAATGLETFIKGYSGSDTIAGILDGIRSDIGTLQKDVFGDPDKGTDGIQTLIDTMLKALYGDTMDKETASDDSIYGRISALSKKLIYSNFNSLEYIPFSENGCAIIKEKSTWQLSLEFIIRPASLASILSEDNCQLYIYNVDDGSYSEFDTSISDADPETGTFVVTGSAKNGHGIVKPNLNFAVLYVEAEDGEETLSFTSRYIPLEVL